MLDNFIKINNHVKDQKAHLFGIQIKALLIGKTKSGYDEILNKEYD